MDQELTVRPAALRQFGTTDRAFYLVTDADLVPRFSIADDGRASAAIVPAVGGADVSRIVRELPDESDVLIAAPGCFVDGSGLDDIGGRRVAVMPCGSTPVRPDQLRYFLGVLERTDPLAQEKRATEFFDAVGGGGTVRLLDDARDATCVFDALDDSYVWNQQAGELSPGEQQIAPAGELSVLPMEITEFDPARRLRLTGTLALRGEPIVHAGYPDAPDRQQAELYARLTVLRRQAVLAELEEGVIVHLRPAQAGSAVNEAAAALLTEVLDAEPRYRTVWELGVGINTAMKPVPANCGLNEVYGADRGVVHLGVGLTPFTAFALTFLCPDTRLTVDGETVIGGSTPAATSRRLTYNREASCGCH